MKLWQTGPGGGDERLERFTAGSDVEYDRALVRYELLSSIAHAVTLHESGLLTGQELEALHRVLVALLDQEVPITAEEEDVHTAVESWLTEQLGELGKKLHTGRSRNDQVLADTRLCAREGLVGIALSLLDLANRLVEFASKHERAAMPGYTHTRRAMPSTVGLWAGAYAEALLDHLTPIEAAYRLNDQSPLGAAAGYGAPLKLDRARTAELLGFKRVQNNALYVIMSRGTVEFVIVSALAALMLTLSRLAEDLILFSTEEFGFFVLPQRYSTGSSLMPQKRNPDVLELVRGRGAAACGELVEIALIVKNLPAGYHRDTQETKGALLRALGTAQEALAVLPPLVEELKVDRDALNRAMSPELFAADEVFRLVGEGVPFREAYRRVKVKLEGPEPVPPIPEGWLEARAAIGAPGNLGLRELQERTQREAAAWRSERDRVRAILSRLTETDGEGGEA